MTTADKATGFRASQQLGGVRAGRCVTGYQRASAGSRSRRCRSTICSSMVPLLTKRQSATTAHRVTSSSRPYAFNETWELAAENVILCAANDAPRH